MPQLIPRLSTPSDDVALHADGRPVSFRALAWHRRCNVGHSCERDSLAITATRRWTAAAPSHTKDPHE